MAETKAIWSAHEGSQALFLTCPYYDAFLGGGRGGGKTNTLLVDFHQDTGRGFGMAWRGALFRRTYPDLADVINQSKALFSNLNPCPKYNEGSHVWTWPDGEQFLFRYIRKPADYWNYHGHQFTWQGWDELVTQPTPEAFDSMKSCSRTATQGIPVRRRSTGNPYGVGHNWVKSRYVTAGPWGVPILQPDGTYQVYIHSTLDENITLMAARPEYAKQLEADTNLNRAKAWRWGDWDVVSGGMFDDVWDRDVHVLKPFSIPHSWHINRSFDWGSARPFSVGWWAESDGTQIADGRCWPRGTIFRIAEWYGWTGEANKGIAMPAVEIARGIIQREKAWGVHDRVHAGPADTQIFSTEPGKSSIAEDMEAVGVDWTRADKKPGTRKQGWEAIRTRLKAAKHDHLEDPGLYVFNDCTDGFLRTVPVLVRGEKDPEDIDPEAEDHTADEVRYRVLDKSKVAGTVKWEV